MVRHNTRSMADDVNFFQETLDSGDIDVTKEASKGSKMNDNTDSDTITVTIDKPNIKHLSMFDYFGLNPNTVSDDDTELLRKISEHVGAVDKQSISDELSSLEFRIGKPKLGMSRLQHVYNYLRLMASAKDAMESVKTYEDKGGDRE